MGRSRYKIYEPTHPHFLTCTILNWLPIFTRQENLKLYAYVILENHLHLIAQGDDNGWERANSQNSTLFSFYFDDY